MIGKKHNLLMHGILEPNGVDPSSQCQLQITCTVVNFDLIQLWALTSILS